MSYFLHHPLSVFLNGISLCSPGSFGTHFVDQASLELRRLPASAFQVLGLRVCATTVLLSAGIKRYPVPLPCKMFYFLGNSLF